MSAQNPELAEVLLDAPTSFDYKENWSKRITWCSNQIKADNFNLRGVNYGRITTTAAALLASDPFLRQLAEEQSIDVRAFDNIVGQVQQLILTKTKTEPPGAKVAKVLRVLTGV